eukprot:11178003-Lingulodinium_polyedra.AAC.1
MARAWFGPNIARTCPNMPRTGSTPKHVRSVQTCPGRAPDVLQTWPKRGQLEQGANVPQHATHMRPTIAPTCSRRMSLRDPSML